MVHCHHHNPYYHLHCHSHHHLLHILPNILSKIFSSFYFVTFKFFSLLLISKELKAIAKTISGLLLNLKKLFSIFPFFLAAIHLVRFPQCTGIVVIICVSLAKVNPSSQYDYLWLRRAKGLRWDIELYNCWQHQHLFIFICFNRLSKNKMKSRFNKQGGLFNLHSELSALSVWFAMSFPILTQISETINCLSFLSEVWSKNIKLDEQTMIKNHRNELFWIDSLFMEPDSYNFYWLMIKPSDILYILLPQSMFLLSLYFLSQVNFDYILLQHNLWKPFVL